jgi:molecular chaperone DnaK
MQELSEVLQRVGAAVYQQAGPPPPGEEPPGGKPPEEGTVEGEFREV